MRCPVVAVLLVGCGFHGTGAVTDDATPHDDAVPIDDRGDPNPDGSIDPIDSPSDATVGPECNGTYWLADFSRDPTTLDINGDGLPDWHARTGTFPTTQLDLAGIWHAQSGPGAIALDTNPAQDFATKTFVHGRMRTTGNVIEGPNALGGVFWINFANTAGHFAPLYLDIRDGDPGTARARIFTWDNGVQKELANLAFSATGLVEFGLVVNDGQPRKVTYTFVTSGGTSSASVDAIEQSNPTLTGWATYFPYANTDYDYLSVEVCP